MSDKYLDPGGIIVPASSLSVARAVELAKYLEGQNNSYASIVDCHSRDGQEFVVMDVVVELPQSTVNPINTVERLAVVFSAVDDVAPEVLALRKNFPAVPHLNLRLAELPRSLCLYDQPFGELKLTWTAARFVEQIRTWLARTAKGILHQEDQSLEPMLPAVFQNLIVPNGPGALADSVLRIAILRRSLGRVFYTVLSGTSGQNNTGVAFAAFVMECLPQPHGVIHRIPPDLCSLHEMTAVVGYDLLGCLRQRIRAGCADKNVFNLPLVLIVRFPKTRKPGGSIEMTDTYAFLTATSVNNVGVSVGVFQRQDSGYGLMLHDDTSRRGNDVPVELLAPLSAFDRTWAAVLNGRVQHTPVRTAAIGAGAIGSQVIMNLARAGVGIWTIIDNDVLLPHNLARHALAGPEIGESKATALARSISTMLNDSQAASALNVDVLQPGTETQGLTDALTKSQMILDFSASVALARHLALDQPSKARRVSFFVTPSARESVLLAEDSGRRFTLDSLEMQYYRAVLTHPGLVGHLSDDYEQQRYGRACSDVSATTPQHLVALHAAIGSHAVQDVCDSPTARIRIWRAAPDTLSVQLVDIPPAKPREFLVNGWRIITDNAVLARLSRLRRAKRQKETGGVLLGLFDTVRKIIHIADVLPSPPDSEEWPTLYIRGCQGLRGQVESAAKRTGYMVTYVGEWHSHPDGTGVLPSSDDKKVFAWLRSHMETEGYPPVMAIVGGGGQLGIVVG